MTRQILMELVFLSLSGTVLGLLLWLLRPLTRRLLSWKWHYYLWLAVLLRLALPVHVDMGWEIFPARESGAVSYTHLFPCKKQGYGRKKAYIMLVFSIYRKKSRVYPKICGILDMTD